MIYTLSGRQRSEYSSVFARLHRLRYDVFVGMRNWTLPSHGRLERDQYDVDDAQYFFGADADGQIYSHVRLNPAMTGSLLADCYSHLVSGPQPIRAPGIYEGTRYIVQPRAGARVCRRAAKAELLCAMFQWIIRQNGTHVQVIIETQMLPSYMELTPEVRPLGLSEPYAGGPKVKGGGEAIAIRCPANDKVIDDLRRFGGLMNGIEPIPMPSVGLAA